MSTSNSNHYVLSERLLVLNSLVYCLQAYLTCDLGPTQGITRKNLTASYCEVAGLATPATAGLLRSLDCRRVVSTPPQSSWRLTVLPRTVRRRCKLIFSVSWFHVHAEHTHTAAVI